MPNFFDKKEEVINIELTQYGKHLLSKGKFRPEYYAFYDQRIKLSWNVSGLGNFSEATLGELPLVGEHVSTLSQFILFEFLFDSIYYTIQNYFQLVE